MTPPPWAENVEQNEDGSVSVGPPPKDDARSRAESANNQSDRIEAKLDYLIALFEGNGGGN